MLRKLIIVAVLIAGLFAAAAPAQATCKGGRVGKHEGQIVVELPECNPII